MHFKLITEIIDLSTANTWEVAKQEWLFSLAYYSDEPQICLCGHYPIRNICVIRNRTNSVVTEVGNCCIKNFLGIDDGDKIFGSIKKIKNDINASISAEVLEYIYWKNGITAFDYKFYSDIYRKRKLSEKQLQLKQKINKKFLRFTSYEINSHFYKINLILAWAKYNNWFDTHFVFEIKRRCEMYGNLSDKQVNALDTIITKFNITNKP